MDSVTVADSDMAELATVMAGADTATAVAVATGMVVVPDMVVVPVVPTVVVPVAHTAVAA
jgi:hypothetical protein